MTTDIELVNQFSKENKKEIIEVENLSFHDSYSAAYCLDADKNVIKLAFENQCFENFPQFVLKLKKLKYLSFYRCLLEKIPSEIKQLTDLEELSLSGNKLTEFPPEVTNLLKLKTLYLNNNSLKVIPSEIFRLSRLEKLYITDNLLEKLPAEIATLARLRILALQRNKIKKIHPEFVKLVNLDTLYLESNPITQPPTEIATGDDNLEKIRNYFEDLISDGIDYIYEAKLILVGEPGAGKTSLAKKLIDPSYVLDPQEEMTQGIGVNSWYFPFSDTIDFKCNVWDFGGQEIMHATHRYFLTKRSLYILVADNRKEDTDFYYWLNIIRLFAGDSPVLIVNNEKFNHKRHIPINVLKSFTNIKDVHNINLADNKGLADLSVSVQDYLKKLDHVGSDPIPRKWVNVRKELEGNSRDHIPIKNYYQICNNNEIIDSVKRNYVSGFLHDLGVLLHFQNEPILANTIILNTNWATEAVYLVLFDLTIIENGGKFSFTDLAKIWHQRIYSNKHNELLQLMLKFELCYEIYQTKQYIVPELLPDTPPANIEKFIKTHFKSSIRLNFEFRYDFMPKGIISRLIVRMNQYISKDYKWKYGVILKIENSYIEIIEFCNKSILKIQAVGPKRIEALVIVRNKIHEVHGMFENLNPSEMVPCNCKECLKSNNPHFFSYDELTQYKQEGIDEIRCRNQNIKNVNVLQLLSDVGFQRKSNEVHFGEENKGGNVTINNIQNQISKQNTNVSQVTSIDIDINIELPKIQDDFVELKDMLTCRSPQLGKKLEQIEDSLDEVSLESDKKELVKPMNKMRRFLEQINNEDSDLHKVVKGTTKCVELAKKLGKTYNKFAQWLALPSVPDLLLGK